MLIKKKTKQEEKREALLAAEFEKLMVMYGASPSSWYKHRLMTRDGVLYLSCEHGHVHTRFDEADTPYGGPNGKWNHYPRLNKKADVAEFIAHFREYLDELTKGL
jgi:hypothetical protein